MGCPLAFAGADSTGNAFRPGFFSTGGIPVLELLLLGRSMEFFLRGVQEAIRQVASNLCVQWQSFVFQPFSRQAITVCT